MTDLWLFGYGSLVWRPDFEFDATRVGVVEGWARRFWQGSTDHRGVPGAPGRVATLIRSPGTRTGGIAYRVSASAKQHVLERLDHREQGGYEKSVEELIGTDGKAPDRLTVTMYVAGPDNPNYLGEAALADIAEQVRCSAGPSGPNEEYVLRLADALAALNIEDRHVAALATALRRLSE